VNELVHGRRSRQTAKSISLVGIGLYYVDDEKKEAMEWMKESLEIRRDILGKKHEDTADSLFFLASMLDQNDKKEEANAMHKKALKIRKRVFGKKHAKTAESLFHINKGKKDVAALEVMRKVLRTQENVLGREHKDTARTIMIIADQLDHNGEKKEALTMLKEAFPVIGNVYGKDSDGAIDIQNNMARLSLELENEATMGMRIIEVASEDSDPDLSE